jgi:hypothetical protein
MKNFVVAIAVAVITAGAVLANGIPVLLCWD